MADKQKQRVMEAAVLAETAATIEAQDFDPEEAALADEAAERAAEAAALAQPAATVGGNGGVNLTFDQLMALVQAAKGNTPTYEQMVEMATKAANAGADRVKPKELSIAQTERKSAYNPLGEKNHPRQKLKCHMYFGSAPLGSTKEVTTLTHEEIAALNDLTPGHYRVRKTDGSSAVVEIKGQMNSNRQLDRLWILLPSGDENKTAYPTLAEFARQCGETNRVDPVIAA